MITHRIIRDLFIAPKSALRLTALLLVSLGLEPAFSAEPATATYDFDTGTPALTTGQNTPFDQTSGGITAHFSALAGSFSIQTDTSSGLSLSQFSGHYLYHNVAGSILKIQFSQQVSNLSFTFATSDFPPIEIPTPIVLTAYTNSTTTPPVGSVTNRATYGSDTLPMGTLTFNSVQPFDLVTIAIQPKGGMGFFLDNLAVKVSAVTNSIPQLEIWLATPTSAVVAWPWPSPNYMLQQNSDIKTATWVNATNAITIVDSQNQVTVPASEGNCFFRLFHP
jgi:hypothetical protein